MDDLDMADSASIEVILARMEGKIDNFIDRFGDRMTRFEQDVHDVRLRLHNTGNEVQIIMSANMPAFKSQQERTNADVNARIKTLEDVEQQRKGAAALGRMLWALMGVAGSGTVAVLLRIMGAI